MSVLVEMSWKTINQQKICIPTRHHYVRLTRLFLLFYSFDCFIRLLSFQCMSVKKKIRPSLFCFALFPKDFDLTMLRVENKRGSIACHQDINNDTIFIRHFNQLTRTLFFISLSTSISSSVIIIVVVHRISYHRNVDFDSNRRYTIDRKIY
jgi:hypothetical protein